jgi:hypothetical protein
MLRFIESCEHASNPLQKWGGVRLNFGGGGATAGAYSSGARHGTKSISMNDCRNVGRIFDNQAIWICGAAWQFGSHQDGVYTFQDGGFAGTQQIRLYFDAPSATLSVRRGGTHADGTVLGSYVIPSFSASQWYFVEMKVTIDNSAGVAIVRVNGAVVINLSAIDTTQSANAYADTVRLGSSGDGNVNTALVDDISICDGQTGAGSNPNNDFLGDVRVDYQPADGNGNLSQWLGSDGNSTDNYLLVDDATPDDDSTYVESSTVGQIDTYTAANVTPSAGTVFGIQPILRARKTTAGARSIASAVRLSGTETYSANRALGTSYEYLLDIRETDPGGGDWSISDLNSLEVGEKVTV